MRVPTSLPLDDDIIDRVLAFSPNFGTLHTTICCRPSLADAVRAVRSSDVPLLFELQESMVLSANEKHELEENCRIVQRFEDLFVPGSLLVLPSRKQRPQIAGDRTGREEGITPLVFPGAIDRDADCSGVCDPDVHGSVWRQRTRYGDPIQWALSAGPARILEAFKIGSDEPIQREFDVDIYQGDNDYAEYDDFFTNAFSRIWKDWRITNRSSLRRRELSRISSTMNTKCEMRASRWRRSVD
ncbi:hypothetical protein B0H17DRAFT_1130124 [Mycena rosella]|uniref:Uncharacterized protein n=1 Tax=Mycena rosella TaxID=1033263 RepID=A0AAD7DR71_MYCRO|nr:hypothetical protein B0H17DRAFT_1130124 [Mycena rosella]